ncbi:hypothetical protein LguiB_018640 [Lonicera macranthoides]
MPTNRKARGRDYAHKLKNIFFFLLKRSVSLPSLDKFFLSGLGFLRAECLRICREKQFFEKYSSCSICSQEPFKFIGADLFYAIDSFEERSRTGETLGFAFQCKYLAF